MVSSLYTDYCRWITRNPVEAADYETIFKWGSLLCGGRSKSTVITELLFATSNLITLHNDIVILKTNKLLSKGSEVKIWLSVLEYSEIFLELSASRFGSIMKHAVILSIQLIRCFSRLYLIGLNRECLIPNPPISPVERFSFKNMQTNPVSEGIAVPTRGLSGIIREIPCRRKFKKPQIVSDHKFLAEIIFTLKPISHLSATYLFGSQSWKPFLFSLWMDAWSLIIYRKESERLGMNPEEVTVLSQRYVRLLLYFLRSPLYDNFFKAVLIFLFNKIFENVPFTKAVLKPFLLYLMKVQSIYFYMWSC